MPYEDDESRRAARERLQARMARREGDNSSAYSAQNHSTTATSRPRREPRQSGARDADYSTERTRREGKAGSTGPRIPLPGNDGESPLSGVKERIGDFFAVTGENRTVEIGPVSFDLPFDLPERIPPIAVPIAAALIVLLLIFAVLIPSCTRAPEGDTQGQQEQQSEQTASGDAASSQGQGIVSQVAEAKAKAESAVKSAGSVSGVDKQETHQGALVELLGDETSAKLLAQAKTNADALWIAAHPKEYAFDGVEVQYKVLKLAADEPAALDYVRQFPTSYPAESVNMDK